MYTVLIDVLMLDCSECDTMQFVVLCEKTLCVFCMHKYLQLSVSLQWNNSRFFKIEVKCLGDSLDVFVVKVAVCCVWCDHWDSCAPINYKVVVLSSRVCVCVCVLHDFIVLSDINLFVYCVIVYNLFIYCFTVLMRDIESVWHVICQYSACWSFCHSCIPETVCTL